jgi:hypothetical protein
MVPPEAIVASGSSDYEFVWRLARTPLSTNGKQRLGIRFLGAGADGGNVILPFKDV